MPARSLSRVFAQNFVLTSPYTLGGPVVPFTNFLVLGSLIK